MDRSTVYLTIRSSTMIVHVCMCVLPLSEFITTLPSAKAMHTFTTKCTKKSGTEKKKKMETQQKLNANTATKERTVNKNSKQFHKGG